MKKYSESIYGQIIDYDQLLLKTVGILTLKVMSSDKHVKYEL